MLVTSVKSLFRIALKTRTALRKRPCSLPSSRSASSACHTAPGEPPSSLAVVPPQSEAAWSRCRPQHPGSLRLVPRTHLENRGRNPIGRGSWGELPDSHQRAPVWVRTASFNHLSSLKWIWCNCKLIYKMFCLGWCAGWFTPALGLATRLKPIIEYVLYVKMVHFLQFAEL